jgi:hypothetical protein
LTHIRALDAIPITPNESICRIRRTEGLSNYSPNDPISRVIAMTVMVRSWKPFVVRFADGSVLRVSDAP